jgi:hypothetical protein
VPGHLQGRATEGISRHGACQSVSTGTHSHPSPPRCFCSFVVAGALEPLQCFRYRFGWLLRRGCAAGGWTRPSLIAVKGYQPESFVAGYEPYVLFCLTHPQMLALHKLMLVRVPTIPPAQLPGRPVFYVADSKRGRGWKFTKPARQGPEIRHDHNTLLYRKEGFPGQNWHSTHSIRECHTRGVGD